MILKFKKIEGFHVRTYIRHIDTHACSPIENNFSIHSYIIKNPHGKCVSVQGEHKHTHYGDFSGHKNVIHHKKTYWKTKREHRATGEEKMKSISKKHKSNEMGKKIGISPNAHGANEARQIDSERKKKRNSINADDNNKHTYIGSRRVGARARSVFRCIRIEFPREKNRFFAL